MIGSHATSSPAGIEILKNQGLPFIIVLGHSEYDPRFGF
jgi:predicted N-acetyltransferase YhbS